MPTYEYRCANGHTFEVTQRMADDPITECQICGAPVERVFHPVAVHFKGSGFYTTDYGRGRSGAGASSDSSSGESSGTPRATPRILGDSSKSGSSKGEGSKSDSGSGSGSGGEKSTPAKSESKSD